MEKLHYFPAEVSVENASNAALAHFLAETKLWDYYKNRVVTDTIPQELGVDQQDWRLRWVSFRRTQIGAAIAIAEAVSETPDIFTHYAILRGVSDVTEEHGQFFDDPNGLKQHTFLLRSADGMYFGGREGNYPINALHTASRPRFLQSPNAEGLLKAITAKYGGIWPDADAVEDALLNSYDPRVVVSPETGEVLVFVDVIPSSIEEPGVFRTGYTIDDSASSEFLRRQRRQEMPY